MESLSQVKQLVKILVGVAWIDGQIQPEERQYLQGVAQKQGLADDPELKSWLSELRPISTSECYAGIGEYLGATPTLEACQQLIEAISGLIYSDGDVGIEEAKLLTQLQETEPSSVASGHLQQSVVQALQTLYRRWVNR